MFDSEKEVAVCSVVFARSFLPNSRGSAAGRLPPPVFARDHRVIGVTIGFGISGPWWLRILTGAVAVVALVAAVKLGTASGRGPIARLANWVIGAEG